MKRKERRNSFSLYLEKDVKLVFYGEMEIDLNYSFLLDQFKFIIWDLSDICHHLTHSALDLCLVISLMMDISSPSKHISQVRVAFNHSTEVWPISANQFVFSFSFCSWTVTFPIESMLCLLNILKLNFTYNCNLIHSHWRFFCCLNRNELHSRVAQGMALWWITTSNMDLWSLLAVSLTLWLLSPTSDHQKTRSS